MNFVDMRREKKVVSCPNCGNQLFKGHKTELVEKCDNCKRFIVCIVSGGKVETFESRRKSERKLQK